MEDNKTFVDETDYKSLWEYSNKKRGEAETLASARLDQIEDLERQLAEVRRELQDAQDRYKTTTDYLNKKLNKAMGAIDAYQYAIRYYMAGDPA